MGPIGNAVTTTTHLAVTAGGPDDREMAVGAPAGNDRYELDTRPTVRRRRPGDTHQLDGGGTHVTYVTERVSYEGQFHLKIADRSARRRLSRERCRNLDAAYPG
jgi:hypothetical protein